MNVLEQSRNILQFNLTSFQDEFLFSQARYPAMISGVGTGKSLCLILKALRICQDYPDSLVLIVRNEFTDLKDSTLKDFERYSGLVIGTDKEVHFSNKSILMFRHSAEFNVLRNINLTAFGIEQIDECDEETFTFLRDRLRRANAPIRQGFIVGNTCGHNFVWRLWKNNPPSKEYHLIEATTFDNAKNLPKDFIEDLKRMSEEAPNHYRRYVLNDWSETAGDDFLFTWDLLNMSRNLHFPNESHKTVIGVDSALFGECKTAFSIIRDTSHGRWEHYICEAYQDKDSRWSFGHYVNLRAKTQADFGVVDADGGYGDGLISSCKEIGLNILSFHANEKAKNQEFYADRRAECYFKLKELIESQQLKILDDDELIDELLTIRFKYKSGKRAIVSKEEMRKEGIKSPDKADSLCYAIAGIDQTFTQQEVRERYTPARQTPMNVGFGFKKGD